MKKKTLVPLFIIILCILGLFVIFKPKDNEEILIDPAITYGEHYNSKDDVALYLDTYKELPPNYVTKKEAEKLGWIASSGNLRDVCDDCSIGGDRFGNYEGLLPEKDERTYYECDIDYDGGTRNAKRIIYSNDGLIYYTDDHYKTFILLYGDE